MFERPPPYGPLGQADRHARPQSAMVVGTQRQRCAARPRVVLPGSAVGIDVPGAIGIPPARFLVVDRIPARGARPQFRQQAAIVDSQRRQRAQGDLAQDVFPHLVAEHGPDGLALAGIVHGLALAKRRRRALREIVAAGSGLLQQPYACSGYTKNIHSKMGHRVSPTELSFYCI